MAIENFLAGMLAGAIVALWTLVTIGYLYSGSVDAAELSPPVAESLTAPEWVQWADAQYDVSRIVEPPCLEPVGISYVLGCAVYHPHGNECWHPQGSKIWHVWDEAAAEYRKEYKP